MTEIEIEIIEQYRLLTPEQKATFRQNLKETVSYAEWRPDRLVPNGEDPQ